MGMDPPVGGTFQFQIFIFHSRARRDVRRPIRPTTSVIPKQKLLWPHEFLSMAWRDVHFGQFFGCVLDVVNVLKQHAALVRDI